MRALAAAVTALCAVGVAADTPFIDASADTFDNLDYVNVKFGGLTYDQAKYAWIGVYSPANADRSAIAALPYPATAPWTATAPVKYIYLYQMNSSGSGSWSFELINMYETVSFSIFSGGIEAPTLLATSGTLKPKSAPPLRGHLTRGANETVMVLTWNSNSSGTAANHQVQWGASSGSYTNNADATTSTYTKGDMCGAPANGQGWFSPHYWHSATMTDLVPGTTYYYIYGSDADGWSAEYSFTALEAPNANTPINFIVYADMGMAEPDGTVVHWNNPDAPETTQRMIDRAQTGDYSLAIHVGDVSYSTGMQAKWYLFDERVSVLGRELPMTFAHGNHERDFPNSGVSSYYSTSMDSGGECGVATVTRYPTPPAPGNPNPLNSTWYSFAQGPMTWIMLNSELPVEPTSAQYAFLESTLKAIDRTTTPWVLVGFHRPMYYGSTRDPNFAQFEDLLYQYQVDVVLTGHVHYAQVFCAIYNSECMTPASPGAYDAPKHVIIGNAGMDLTPLSPSSSIIEYQASEYGYSTINIASPTELNMYFYADADDGLHYQFTITRDYPRAAVPLPLPARR